VACRARFGPVSSALGERTYAGDVRYTPWRGLVISRSPLRRPLSHALGALLLIVVGLACSIGEAGAAVEPAAAIGPDPFTQDSAVAAPSELLDSIEALRSASEAVSSDTPQAGAVAAAEAATELALPIVEAPSPIGVGLYGGTEANACDVGGMISFFEANPGHATAWSTVMGVTESEIPDFLRSLTSGWLLTDTEVVNHGFKNGAATPRSSVLEAGTAVLVDADGIPRVRCKCGNPLKPAPSMLQAHQLSGGWAFGLQSSDLPAGVAATNIDIDVVLSDCTGNRCQGDLATSDFGALAAVGEGLRNLTAVVPGVRTGDCNRTDAGVVGAAGVYDVEQVLELDASGGSPTLTLIERAILARPASVPPGLQCQEQVELRSVYLGTAR